MIRCGTLLHEGGSVPILTGIRNAEGACVFLALTLLRASRDGGIEPVIQMTARALQGQAA
jgi:hypothetical protein